jgi:hypothetical protein
LMGEPKRDDRPKYERPVLVDLGELARGQGACLSGSSDFGGCSGGSTANGQCYSGGMAHGGCGNGGQRANEPGWRPD